MKKNAFNLTMSSFARQFAKDHIYLVRIKVGTIQTRLFLYGNYKLKLYYMTVFYDFFSH